MTEEKNNKLINIGELTVNLVSEPVTKEKYLEFTLTTSPYAVTFYLEENRDNLGSNVEVLYSDLLKIIKRANDVINENQQSEKAYLINKYASEVSKLTNELMHANKQLNALLKEVKDARDNGLLNEGKQNDK